MLLKYVMYVLNTYRLILVQLLGLYRFQRAVKPESCFSEKAGENLKILYKLIMNFLMKDCI